jgi:F-type H+-transporting ATPase subunit delta
MEIRIAKRYARAVFASAKQADNVRDTELNLKLVCDALKSNEEFYKTFLSPKISRDKKRTLLEKIFSSNVDALVMRLLKLLVNKRREDGIDTIFEELVKLRENDENIQKVSIKSAIELSQNELDELVEKLEQKTGKRIVYESSIDPELIGGVLVQYGDTIYDGSVKGALRRLREKLFYDVLKQA